MSSKANFLRLLPKPTFKEGGREGEISCGTLAFPLSVIEGLGGVEGGEEEKQMNKVHDIKGAKLNYTNAGFKEK